MDSDDAGDAGENADSHNPTDSHLFRTLICSVTIRGKGIRKMIKSFNMLIITSARELVGIDTCPFGAAKLVPEIRYRPATICHGDPDREWIRKRDGEAEADGHFEDRIEWCEDTAVEH